MIFENNSFKSPQGYDLRGHDQRQGYVSYNYQRRPIQSSPHQEPEGGYKSPVFRTPTSTGGSVTSGISPIEPVDFSSYKSSPASVRDDFSLKNSLYPQESPRRIPVSMPGGIEYEVSENEELPKRERERTPMSTPRQYMKYGDYNAVQNVNSPYYIQHSRNQTPSSANYQFSNIGPYNSPMGPYIQYPPIQQFDPNIYNFINQQNEKLRVFEEERLENKRLLNATLEMLNELKEQNAREKESKERNSSSKSEKPNKTPVNRTPDISIPIGEPIKKSRIPDYENMSDLEKSSYVEKFRNNYNLLKMRYPMYKIQVPDFDVLPLRTIHERYEEIIKTICIYQTAMKFKVYLVIIIAGIEYIVGYKYNQKFARGFLDSQIKTIHKFDIYLIDFASTFYTSEVGGEEYPVWLKFLTTFSTSLIAFSTINGAVSAFGMKADDDLFNEIDKFVSPPGMTADLHSDGISDVPSPPERDTLQDPNSSIQAISWLFNMFKGFKGISGGSSDSQSSQSSNSNNPQRAEPIPTKKVTLDEFDEADL